MCSGAFELDQCYGVMIDIVACHFAKMMVMGEHNDLAREVMSVKFVTTLVLGGFNKHVEVDSHG